MKFEVRPKKEYPHEIFLVKIHVPLFQNWQMFSTSVYDSEMLWGKSSGDAVLVVLPPLHCTFKQEGRRAHWTDCPGISLVPHLTFLNSTFSTLLLFLLFSALQNCFILNDIETYYLSTKVMTSADICSSSVAIL